jgi:hypothetical protein
VTRRLAGKAGGVLRMRANGPYEMVESANWYGEQEALFR